MTMTFEEMTSMEIEAFYQFAEALYEGRIKPPEGVRVADTVEETIRQMMQMYLVLRTPDHNSVLAVYQAMQVADARLVDVAMSYVRRRKMH